MYNVATTTQQLPAKYKKASSSRSSKSKNIERKTIAGEDDSLTPRNEPGTQPEPEMIPLEEAIELIEAQRFKDAASGVRGGRNGGKKKPEKSRTVGASGDVLPKRPLSGYLAFCQECRQAAAAAAATGGEAGGDGSKKTTLNHAELSERCALCVECSAHARARVCVRERGVRREFVRDEARKNSSFSWCYCFIILLQITLFRPFPLQRKVWGTSSR